MLDDYTKNLLEWESKGGKGIKLLNGMNWSKKSWKGDVVFYETSPSLLAESIVLLGTRGQGHERTISQNIDYEKGKDSIDSVSKINSNPLAHILVNSSKENIEDAEGARGISQINPFEHKVKHSKPKIDEIER